MKDSETLFTRYGMITSPVRVCTVHKRTKQDKYLIYNHVQVWVTFISICTGVKFPFAGSDQYNFLTDNSALHQPIQFASVASYILVDLNNSPFKYKFVNEFSKPIDLSWTLSFLWSI